MRRTSSLTLYVQSQHLLAQTMRVHQILLNGQLHSAKTPIKTCSRSRAYSFSRFEPHKSAPPAEATKAQENKYVARIDVRSAALPDIMIVT